MSELCSLRIVAAEHFSNDNASVTSLQTVRVPGMPILGDLLPSVFGAATFERFMVILSDGNGPRDVFEVSQRRGGDCFIVTHDQTVYGWLGQATVCRVSREKEPQAVLQRLGIGAP